MSKNKTSPVRDERNPELQFRTFHSGTKKRSAGAARLLGFIMLALAVFLAWKTHWFHAEKDLSAYPEIQLSFTTCKFERITHSKGSTTRQIVLITEGGR